MKEKEYANFNIMLREMQDHLLENEGTIINIPFINFGFDKFSFIHKETKQIFSIKTKYLHDEKLYSAILSKDGIDALAQVINDIEKLKQADAVGNVKC